MPGLSETSSRMKFTSDGLMLRAFVIMLKNIRIVDTKLFKRATQIRTRYPRGKAKRPPMPPDRKTLKIEKIFNRYNEIILKSEKLTPKILVTEDEQITMQKTTSKTPSKKNIKCPHCGSKTANYDEKLVCTNCSSVIDPNSIKNRKSSSKPTRDHLPQPDLQISHETAFPSMDFGEESSQKLAKIAPCIRCQRKKHGVHSV